MRLPNHIIAASPQMAAWLHGQAKALGMGHLVDFRHEIGEQKDVYALVKVAKTAVFRSAREGFGIAAQEAIASGVPVATTSASGNLAWYLVARSASGIVCRPSAQTIAEAVERLVQNSGAQANEMDEVRLAEHSWDAVTDQVARVVKDTRRSHPHGG